MLKLIATAALSFAVAGAAFAQGTPSQQLAGGTWACTTLSDGMHIVSKQSYNANGTSAVTVMVFGETDGVALRIAAEGVGTWSFVGDRLDEKLSVMTATFADIGGQRGLDVAQSLLNETMVNILLSSTAKFDGPTLNMLDAEGVVTDCVR